MRGLGWKKQGAKEGDERGTGGALIRSRVPRHG